MAQATASREAQPVETAQLSRRQNAMADRLAHLIEENKMLSIINQQEADTLRRLRSEVADGDVERRRLQRSNADLAAHVRDIEAELMQLDHMKHVVELQRSTMTRQEANFRSVIEENTLLTHQARVDSQELQRVQGQLQELLYDRERILGKLQLMAEDLEDAQQQRRIAESHAEELRTSNATLSERVALLEVKIQQLEKEDYADFFHRVSQRPRAATEVSEPLLQRVPLQNEVEEPRRRVEDVLVPMDALQTEDLPPIDGNAARRQYLEEYRRNRRPAQATHVADDADDGASLLDRLIRGDALGKDDVASMARRWDHQPNSPEVREWAHDKYDGPQHLRGVTDGLANRHEKRSPPSVRTSEDREDTGTSHAAYGGDVQSAETSQRRDRSSIPQKALSFNDGGSNERHAMDRSVDILMRGRNPVSVTDRTVKSDFDTDNEEAVKEEHVSPSPPKAAPWRKSPARRSPKGPSGPFKLVREGREGPLHAWPGDGSPNRRALAISPSDQAIANRHASAVASPPGDGSPTRQAGVGRVAPPMGDVSRQPPASDDIVAIYGEKGAGLSDRMYLVRLHSTGDERWVAASALEPDGEAILRWKRLRSKLSPTV